MSNTKRYSFVASDCNIIIIAKNKAEAVVKIKGTGKKGAEKASIKSVFIYN